jgi:hypothetical protein
MANSKHSHNLGEIKIIKLKRKFTKENANKKKTKKCKKFHRENLLLEIKDLNNVNNQFGEEYCRNIGTVQLATNCIGHMRRLCQPH